MKKLLLLIIIIFINFKSIGQSSFEGAIKFSTKITTSELAPKGFHKKLTDKYGDSLLMYYSKNGDFKRVYLNSAEFGNDSQIYVAKKGKLFITKKKNAQIDSLDTRENSIVLVSSGKVESESIMGLKSECYQYKAISTYKQNVTLNYCFSSKSPKVNHQLYSKHNDFYLNDYYKISERPYLKFSIETDAFKITYTATELIEKKIEKEKFKIK